jgi:CDP-paratose 2-epimerase
MKVVIIGGAGFIGINAVYSFVNKGHEVVIVDNLSRKGSSYNLEQLQGKLDVGFFNIDIRDSSALNEFFACNRGIDAVLLLAGQVAVTTSVTNPREDFEINAMGTFNVLEAIRISGQKPLVIYSSTNKVYGKMEDLAVGESDSRYSYVDQANGISETRQLDFYSPYGCSKGSGDQYVRDYFRIYDIPTVVFRQSCIYGPNQFGIEDQGWVAWFTIATLMNKDITIYGDGKQIRDVLYVGDLVDLYEKAILNKDIVSGKIYNIGGGPSFTLSLVELIGVLEERFKRKIDRKHSDWRPGDQKVYVSDISKIIADLGWQPTTDLHKGINEMANWIEASKEILNYYVFGAGKEKMPVIDKP